MTRGGLAELAFGVREGRTRLLHHTTRIPLTVQRVLYLDEDQPDRATVFIANPTAGLLAGDHHTISVSVQAGARARVTTQAATKVLSMSGGCAIQITRLTVADGAALEYVPEPLIPFRGAHLQQRIHLEVAQHGTLAYLDIIGAGRVSHGEAYAYECLTWDLLVTRPSGEDLYVESAMLQPRSSALTAPGVVGESNAVGTLIIVDGAQDPRAMLHHLQLSAVWASDRLAAAELPGGGGLVVKALGSSISDARSLLLAVLEASRSREAWMDGSDDRC